MFPNQRYFPNQRCFNQRCFLINDIFLINNSGKKTNVNGFRRIQRKRKQQIQFGKPKAKTIFHASNGFNLSKKKKKKEKKETLKKSSFNKGE